MIKLLSIMIIYLTTIIALVILLSIAYAIGFGVSKNKEKGLSITTIVLLIITAPGVLLNLPSTILYILQADPQKFRLYNGDDDIDRSFITHCILLTTWVSLIVLYLLYRFWLKYQEKAYREMDSVILEYTSRNGFKTFEEFFREVKQDRKTAFVSKMMLRNPAFVPENPKLQPYTVPYRNLIWPKYIYALYQYEISRCSEVICRYIKQNGYELPDVFEYYCASSNAAAVARCIHYPVWTNGGRLENDPFNCIGKSQSPSDYLPYERMMCFLYEEIIRQKCIAEMPMIIECYIEDNGYDSIEHFKDSIEMDCDSLADSVLYDSSCYYLEDGSIIAMNCNLYSESIAKRYEEKVTDDYMREVAEWHKSHRLFGIEDIVQGIPNYEAFFANYYVSPSQCIRPVLYELVNNGSIKQKELEGPPMYISNLISEESAVVNGDEKGNTIDDYDDD